MCELFTLAYLLLDFGTASYHCCSVMKVVFGAGGWLLWGFLGGDWDRVVRWVESKT